MASSLAVRNLFSRQLQKRLPLAASSAASSALSPFSSSPTVGIIRLNSFGGLQQTQTWNNRRCFSTDDKDGKDVVVIDGAPAAAAAAPSSTTTTPAVDYDVEDIMSTFGDTSYYDPLERPDYSDMSNEELKDTSTIPGWDVIHCPPQDKETIPRGALVGTVVSTKMDKTVNVAVDRYRIHKKYRKRLRYTKKFMAHDEAEVASTGDMVMIVPCQRISKHKHFMLREIVRAKGQL
jgi:small subunit ribosomal protein S17